MLQTLRIKIGTAKENPRKNIAIAKNCFGIHIVMILFALVYDGKPLVYSGTTIFLFTDGLSEAISKKARFLLPFENYSVILRAETQKEKKMRQKIMISLLALMLFAVQNVRAQLPAITLKTMDGKSVRVDTLSNNGKPFVIDFFATWCKPCNRELDAISEVYDDWRAETGVKIFAVSLDRAHNIQKVKPLVDNHGWEYDVLLDPNGDLARTFGFQNIPYVVLCDGNGKIVYKHMGYQDGEELELYEKVKEASRK